MKSPGRWTPARAAAILLILTAAGARCAEGETALDEPVPMWSLDFPSAEELRESVLAGMPRTPLRIEARLRSKKRSGRAEREVHAEVLLRPGPDTMHATYTVMDAFGGGAERLEITRDASRPTRFVFYAGDPPIRGDTPDLYAPIKETDLTWIDLSLSFLWWSGGETVARERLRGRTCYVVRTPAPDDEPGAYAGVRMWIDPQGSVLLKVEAFDREGVMVRRLLVDSFKKIDGVWFMKDIDVYSFPSRHKTTLRVDAVEVIEESALLRAQGQED